MSKQLFDAFPRSAGILLHPTSLPGPEGIGTLGAPSFEFVDFLRKAGQSWWQVLPYGPTGYGNCPYLSFSSIAGNPMLIETNDMKEKGWLAQSDSVSSPGEDVKINYSALILEKNAILRKAFEGFLHKGDKVERAQFEKFKHEASHWLDDYALFMAIKDNQKGKPWIDWSKDIRLREKRSIASAHEQLKKEVEYHSFLQFVFFDQWKRLQEYARNNGVRLINDMPLYVAGDSADVWADPELFCLDKNGRPELVSGVPPDYFSEDGQVWGSPVYDWEVHEERNFDWWKRRVSENLKYADLLRIDHFRGLESFWAIPAGEKTGKNGKWVKAPGRKLLELLSTSIGHLPLIAEDLGDITEEVLSMRDDFGLPGMRIMQFGFGDDAGNSHAIHNHTPNCMAYTGTHDNETLSSWLGALDDYTSQMLQRYCGPCQDMHWQLIRLTHMSVAKLTIIPMQDYLKLGIEGRMNRPGVAEGNWDWRMGENSLNEDLALRIRELCSTFGRC